MIKNIFNYAPSEDKAPQIEAFLAEQPERYTIISGVIVASATYVVGFAIGRMLRSAETRIEEYRFDKATVKAAIEIAKELKS